MQITTIYVYIYKYITVAVMKVGPSIIINEAKGVLNKFITLTRKTSANSNSINKYTCILYNALDLNDNQR
jgi:hypothetical protein